MSALARNFIRSHNLAEVQLPPVISLIVVAIATATCVLAWYVFPSIFGNTALDLSSLYYGVFDIFAILTGFLTAIYAFLLSSSNAFIEKIRDTSPYKKFLSLVRWTIGFCGIASVVSLVIVVLKFGPVSEFGWQYVLLLAWVWLVAFTVCNIIRCILVFTEVSENVPRGRIPGG